ncbi:MAG: ABC transporter ATP-binding protein/permease [Holosporales bacterium]|nr:ABC transporter ATP-binding protein/permease [Holosporales bacterium]
MAPVALFGVFHSNFITLGSEDFTFYAQMSSMFILATVFLLSWYYSNMLIRKKTTAQLSKFGITAIDLDVNKISQEDVLHIADDTISKISICEDYKFELLGFATPFAILTIASIGMILYKARDAGLLLFISHMTVGIIITTAVRIVNVCDIRNHRPPFMEFVRNTTAATRGIQLYNASEYILGRYRTQRVDSVKMARQSIKKAVWHSIFYICLLFSVVCFLYTAQKSYVELNFAVISEVEPLYFMCIFFWTMFLTSIMRYMRINSIRFDDISQYVSKRKKSIRTRQIPGNPNLVIAFNKVSFQEPTKISDHPILSDITFSVLPGECISITGENAASGLSIFDLILKYYEPQAGTIHISGDPIESIETESLRAQIGVFSEQFGLIYGTVANNLELANIHRENLEEVVEKIGLSDIKDEEVFDSDGNLSVSQEILLKIQMGRVELQKPNLLLVRAPEKFVSTTAANLFREYLAYVTPVKTLLIATTDPKIVIYSDKILYLGESATSFGPHAELSKNKAYQNYVKNLKMG